MSAITVHTKADANGVLRLELPLGRDAAGRDVRVVVNQSTEMPIVDERWAKIRALAGAWKDEVIEMPPLMALETRDEL